MELMTVKRYLAAETPMLAMRSKTTPNRLFYVLSRFPIPRLEIEYWRLMIEGEVENQLTLNYEEIKELPSEKLTVTTECVGNGRALFDPPCERLDLPQFHYGAVSTADWRGVPLKTILDKAKMKSNAVNVVIEGADKGYANVSTGIIHFARGLPLEKALQHGTMLAYEMNDDPLPEEHGFPLRAIVPGWYGVSSVKWVTRIKVIDSPFDGYYQTGTYVIPEGKNKRQVSKMQVKSLILSPISGELITRGTYLIYGVAWTGEGRISSVEVSTDGGKNWREASLLEPATNYTWCHWRIEWNIIDSGKYVLQVRATDDSGNTQPLIPKRNPHAYENNATHTVSVQLP
jgi:DMSO/TMAO reductase YedYZ molybdopterin-dependent catalytic subunit